MLKKFIPTLVLVLTVTMAASAQARWMGFASDQPAKPEIRVEQSSANTTRVELSLSGVDVETLNVNGTEHSQIRIPGHWFTLQAGQPELPFVTTSLIIADSGSPEVRIVKSTWREMTDHVVVPSKGSILRTVDPATVPYSFGSVYSSGEVYPAVEADLAEPFILRDYRGVSLRINAVRWDAARNTLLVLEDMVLEVVTAGSGGLNEKIRKGGDKNSSAIDSQFENLYRTGFDNYSQGEKYNQVASFGRMLVVSHPAFMSAVQPFVQWKQSMGMQVDLISTAEVGGTTAGIQAAIDSRYAEEASLTYVILVGDQEQVPSYSGTFEGADDDTRYANLEGADLYPDLFVSRISGSNPEDITTQINKFIAYERDPEAGGQWYQKAACLASSQGTPSDIERAQWLRQDLLNYNFTEVHEVYQPEGTTEDISAAVNSGLSLINYIGHGTGSSWTNPYFGVDDVQALTNGSQTPWILDVSCSNGDFSQDECFAESWMRAGGPDQPQGALATYSASTTTPWVPPTVMQAEAVDLLVSEQANVLGSLYFHGIMKVMDEYPGNTQLVEQYNIFGDCSLMVRTTTPQIPYLEYSDIVALGDTVFAVETGLENTRVALYSNGILHGTGLTDATGHVDVKLDNPVAVPGEVTMTVSGYNLLTQVITLQGEVPVLVDISPATLPVGVSTEVVVTVNDPSPNKTVSNVTVTIEGFGVDGLQAVTDASGKAFFTVTAQYGEILLVRGVEDGAGYDMFKRSMQVTGASELTNAQIEASVSEIGMAGTLTPGLSGLVLGTSEVNDFSLSVVGVGIDSLLVGNGPSVSMAVVPENTGHIFATLLKTGFNIYEEEIEVIPANGTLNGTVTTADGGAVLTGVSVVGFIAGDDSSGVPLFDLVTDASGFFSVPVQMPVGSYDVYARKFGYQEHVESYPLMFGANNYSFVMDLAQTTVLAGQVSAVDGGLPLNATVQVFRQDNNDQMALVMTDEFGSYSIDALPYFDYRVTVNSYLYEIQSINISFDQPSMVRDFQMSETQGKILIIDHDLMAAQSGAYPAKLGKGGVVLAESYVRPEASSKNRAVSDLVADLTSLNYSTDVIASSSFDSLDWYNYTLVLVSAGGNPTDFSDELKEALLVFADAGGKLLVEGGDVGFNNRVSSDFRNRVLHMSYWGGDMATSLTVRSADHAIMSSPNTISGPIGFSYFGYGDSDLVNASADAAWPGTWFNITGRSSVICYDPNPAPEGGQIVFFPFNYSSLAVEGRSDLLDNAVAYLSLSELGTATLTGRVRVHGATDHSDAQLSLSPGNASYLTGPDGSYTFFGLVAGEYEVTVTREGFSTSVGTVTVIDDQVAERDFDLLTIVSQTFCVEPGLEIPDNDPEGGVSSSLYISEISTVSQLVVYVEISHSSVADLVVDLISPAGTTVRLHQNETASEYGLVGWYPTDIEPEGDLDLFLGEDIQGEWTLHVADVGYLDVGTIQTWCLVIDYALLVPSSVDEQPVPQVLTLYGNYPNPFNPRTVIRFSQPKAGQTQVVVYDVKGQKIRTLVNDILSSGSHEVSWMGRDDQGRAVASGTYFYRLITENESLVGKMLLIK
ncbi:MAG: T9SS type A sorting domain-containing protein [bacterium]|nr:T9SS type A sorting domain-containing protein [bacterium]